MILSFQQAVLLCGGLGTRLRPLTDNIPKPMVPVNRKPFLYYLLHQLSEQGIKRFVLLTGYLGEQILTYFGDGSAWGWEITYSSGPAEWDTGRRIWEAKELFDPKFLLLYSDNFVQVRLQTLDKLHQQLTVPISLVLAPKVNGNISISETGSITAYDKNRKGEGFDYVEVGYMIIERNQVLGGFNSYAGFPDFNFSLVLQKFADEGKLAGLIVRDPYHSISDPERWEKMCEYLMPKKILLIDRDGTINKKAPKGEYITVWDDFEFITETYDAMKLLAEEGFQFIIITNQAGIARGKMTKADLESLHQKMLEKFKEDKIDILRIYYSPHHWEENSFMRKPNPGMFFEAAKEFNLRLDNCLYIGDDERDCEAAYHAGCGMIYLSQNQSTLNKTNMPSPSSVFHTLTEAVTLIISLYASWTKSPVDSEPR